VISIWISREEKSLRKISGRKLKIPKKRSIKGTEGWEKRHCPISSQKKQGKEGKYGK